MDSRIRVMIIDDHPLVRQGIAKVLEKEPDMEVVAESGNANEAINLIARNEPAFIIADISLEGEVNGIDLVKAVRERFPSIKVLVLSMFDEAIYAERAIRAGARGYMTKKEAPTNVAGAIRAIMKGELYLTGGISGRIIDKLLHSSGDSTQTPVDILTDREFEIFQLLGNGFGTGEIARRLNLSVNTVESHRKKIKDKLGIKKGPELVKSAVQWVLSQS